MTWQPSALQTAATRINDPLRVINASGSVLSTASQVLHTFGGEGAQANAADSQATLQRLSACVGATSGIANALGAPAARIGAMKTEMTMLAGMIAMGGFTSDWSMPATPAVPPPWVKPGPTHTGPQAAAAAAAAYGYNVKVNGIMAVVAQTDWAGYIEIGAIVGQLAMALKNAGGGGGGGGDTGGDPGDDINGDDSDFDLGFDFGEGGPAFDPSTGLANAMPTTANGLTGAPAAAAMAGLRAAGTAALAGGFAAPGGGTFPMGGVPFGAGVPGGRDDDRRGNGADWRLAEDDEGIFAGREVPTENGVLA
jgi:hypothetical protein